MTPHHDPADRAPASEPTGSATSTRTPDQWRSARFVAGASAAVALVLLAFGYLVPLSFVDELPDPVATHWGTDGPDGFTSLDGVGLLVPTLVMAGLVVLLAVLTASLGSTASTRRLLAGTNVGVAGLVSTVQIASLDAQRGLADAHDATDAGIWIAVAVGLVMGIAVAVALPGDLPQPATEPLDREVPRAALGADERAVWVVRTRGAGSILTGVALTALMVALAVILQLWWLLAVATLLGLLFAAMFVFVVRVDAHGLRVRSAVGFPRATIPASEVERASATTVTPLGDFGGWGWRIGRGGRVGVVLRKGPALLVERTGGRSFVVTVDGPEDGAALLNTFADRARS